MIAGNIVFSLVMCILNGLSVKKHSGFRPNIVKTFVKPAAASRYHGRGGIRRISYYIQGNGDKFCLYNPFHCGRNNCIRCGAAPDQGSDRTGTGKLPEGNFYY